MDATQLLTKQHRKVEGIFRKLERKNPDAQALVTELANDLAGHMAIEQELFYPAIHEVDESLVLESYEEHALAEMALKRLLATDPDDIAWKARVTALKELIMHHVEEEEKELFPKVQKALDEETMRTLTKQMRARLTEVVGEGFEAAVPRGFAKTSSDVSRRNLGSTRPRARKPARRAA